VAEGVLYFPYISVPQNAWFARVLLYWDEVGSIVPEPHATDLSRVSTFMRDLVEADLVRPIVPEEYDSRLGRAMGPFLDFVDSDPEIAARAKAGFGSQPATRGGSEPGTVVRIHQGKFGYVLAGRLQERRLARPAGDGRRRREWLEVESRTASAYMAYLSATLGSLEDVEMDPITDTLASLQPFAPTEAADPLALAAELRMGVLEAVLPGPADDISVADLVSFKERYGDLLSRFRRHIEERLLDVALVPDAGAREAKLGFLKAELEDELGEIQGKMRPRWPQLVFGTLCSVVGAAIPVGAALATGALPVAGAALPGLMNAVYTAQAAVRSSGETGRHPLAYAALAREHLAA
jgi:Family of unknown function (DUF6236)